MVSVPWYFSEFYDLDLLRVLAENGGPNSAKLIRKKQFPMKTQRNYLQYAAAVIQGESMTLQDFNTDVSVHAPEGIKAVLWQHVYTEFSRFRDVIPEVIPEDECMVAPVVEIHVKELGEKQEAVQDQYKIKIPHCLTKKEQLSSIIVRSGDVYSKRRFEKLDTKKQSGNTGPFYEVDEKYITIHAAHSCQLVCSTCEQICQLVCSTCEQICQLLCSNCQKICMCSMKVFAYGFLTKLGQSSHMRVKVFLCPAMYRSKPSRRVCIIILLLISLLVEYQPFTIYFN